MELGIAKDLLQPRTVGRMGRRLSASECVVSASTDPVVPSPWVWRELGIPAAELPAAEADLQAYANSAGNAASFA